jgi:hypothetical protein
MKTYAGDRTIDGIVVTVDGQPLDDQRQHHQYCAAGFEWSYEGDGPSQLAYALLVDHLGDHKKAEALQDRFMREIVANFQNEWEMSSADIGHVLSGYTS